MTRCAYFERLGEWDHIVDICRDADPELARRQYKAVRTSLLCARARALARRGQYDEADQTIALAVRVCPRGAVDPLIVLEASKGLTFTLRGETAAGLSHFDRALAACRAISHRYHENWISRTRAEVTGPARDRVSIPRSPAEMTDRALLLNDVATILGAGHSIDLLAHRVSSILSSAGLEGRVTVESESGCEFEPAPSASWENGADGTWRLGLRGSDRALTIRVTAVHTVEEISTLKSLVDIVQAAVNRTADTETEDDDQNLWPRALAPSAEEAVFRSPRMAELLRVAVRLAATDLPILITGETGTGKEILARMIHEASRVKRGPFSPFNCAATPRDLVESLLFGHRRGAFTGAMESSPGVIRGAERGTLFLDEIGDLEPSVQPKLLRFLENGEIQPVGELRPQHVTVRVVAATNADLDRLVEQGRFRQDLFYRVGGARLALPPLRERKDEIPALVSLFVSKFSREYDRKGLRLADEFIAALLLYHWPGNIRELSNEVRRIVAMAGDGDMLSVSDLSPAILQRWIERPPVVAPVSGPVMQIRLDQTLAHAVEEVEQRFIQHAMRASGGRVADAALLLGLSRKGLFLKRRRQRLAEGPNSPLPS